jgi:hypothetical protein
MLYPAELRDLTRQRRFYFTRTLGANASTLLFFRKMTSANISAMEVFGLPHTEHSKLAICRPGFD